MGSSSRRVLLGAMFLAALLCLISAAPAPQPTFGHLLMGLLGGLHHHHAYSYHHYSPYYYKHHYPYYHGYGHHGFYHGKGYYGGAGYWG